MADELNGVYDDLSMRYFSTIPHYDDIGSDICEDYSPHSEMQHSTPDILKHTTTDILQSRRFRDLNLNSYGQSGFFGELKSFGSPSYPSPLDRIRSERPDYGSSYRKESSFEVNQSFPKVTKSNWCLDETMNKPKLKPVCHNPDELNDVSFTSGHSKGSFLPEPHSTSLGENWSFYNYIGGGQSGVVFPKTVQNPNKAICTINAKSSEILIANEMACELFGYETEELLGKKLKDLIELKPKDQATIMESHLDENSGSIVSLAGKVVDAMDSNGLVMPISIWVRKLELEQEHRCLVVMEPVERSVAMFTFNSQGTILSCDHQMAYLYGYFSPDDLEGVSVTDLIPFLILPDPTKPLDKSVRKQRVTGRTKDGGSFPLSVSIKDASEVEDSRNIPPGIKPDREEIYVGVLWVFSSISGLITLLPDGTIHTINENFALLMFGYSKADLIGKDVSLLIPDFYDILDLEENSDVESNHGKESDLNELAKEKNGHLETDSSDDQGIGSSITSNQCHTTRLDGLSSQGPGITSTPNRPHVASFFRRGSDRSGPSETEISPLAVDIQKDSLINRLELSDSEDEVPVTAEVKTDVRSPQNNHSSTSISSTEMLPTAREITHKTTVSSQKIDSPKNNDIDSKIEGSLQFTTNNNASKEETHSGKEPKSKGENSMINLESIFTVNGESLKERTLSEFDRAQSNLVDTTTGNVESYIQIKRETEAVKMLKDTNQILMDIKSSICDKSVAQKDSVSPITQVNHEHSGSSETQVNCKHSGSPQTGVKCKRSVSPITQVSHEHSGSSETQVNCEHSNQSITQSDPVTKKSSEQGDLLLSRDKFSISESSSTDVLATRVGMLGINDSSDSAVIEDRSGTLADVSSNVQSSSAMKESSVASYQEELSSLAKEELSFPVSQDYIPKCNTNILSDSTSSGDTSFEEASLHKCLHQPLINNSCHTRSGSSDAMPNSSHEQSCSALEHHSFANSTDSVSFHERDSGCSPRKHKRRHRHNDRRLQMSQSVVFPEGSYAGHGMHRDRSFLGIIFQIKRVILENGSTRYCMWVSRDPEEPAEGGRSFANLTLASSFNSTIDRSNNFSLGDMLVDKACSDSKIHEDVDEIPVHDKEDTPVRDETPVQDEIPVRDTDMSPVEDYTSDLSPGRGLYDIKYHTCNSIGKGAFGFVKLAKRKTDDTEVVVKFIKKNKVLSECWTFGRKGNKLPLEVTLLQILQHPNIVKVLDVFENDDYIQMVMEKHGSGMDLFEFIDRSPLMDEALASYIFRQIVDAVHYLHSLNIVHRDIKDENVILNENFQIKLIDFGAAAYMTPGKLFGTFCGTMEYCSPEVLLGNRYEGPELEMWSLGVTLYTLVYGENPFFDVEETIKGRLRPPFHVSRGLTFLLSWLLNPSPAKRATIKDCKNDAWTNQLVDISQYHWNEVLPNSEFHGNTASDNRIDSPESKPPPKQTQNDNQFNGRDKNYVDSIPPFSPPSYQMYMLDSHKSRLQRDV